VADATVTAGGPSDEEAIRRVLAGEPDAFRSLVERYQGRVYRMALRILRDEEAARDATQDALLKAYRALPRFQGRARFYTWLYRLAMNHCLDLRRRERPEPHLEWAEGGAAEAEVSEAAAGGGGEGPFAPVAALERKELRERVAAAVDRLGDAARETLLLREVEGLSYAEIAEALGIPKGTVMSRLHYARQKLQRILLDEGVVAATDAREDPR
jgi:RNA polymerase sigma-70 factor (ECF subfamily)